MTKQKNNGTASAKAPAVQATSVAVAERDEAGVHKAMLESVMQMTSNLAISEAPGEETPADAKLAGVLEGIAGDVVGLPGLDEPDTQFDEYLERMLGHLESRASAMLDAIMHDPRVIEPMARWKAIEDVVTDPEFGEALVHLLPVGRGELIKDYRDAGKDITRTALYRYVVRNAYGTAGGIPYLLAVADLEIGTGEDDILLADFLARIGERAHMVVLSNLSASVFVPPDQE